MSNGVKYRAAKLDLGHQLGVSTWRINLDFAVRCFYSDGDEGQENIPDVCRRDSTSPAIRGLYVCVFAGSESYAVLQHVSLHTGEPKPWLLQSDDLYRNAQHGRYGARLAGACSRGRRTRAGA